MKNVALLIGTCLLALNALSGDLVRPRLGTVYNRGYRQWVGAEHEKYNADWFGPLWSPSWRLSKIPFEPIHWDVKKRQMTDPLTCICVNAGKKGEMQLSDAIDTSGDEGDDGLGEMLADDAKPEAKDEGFVIDMPRGVGPRKYMYLLSSLVGGTPKFKMDVVFVNKKGEEAAVPLKWGVDVRDWRDLEPKANCFNEHVYQINPKKEHYVGPGEVGVASATVVNVPEKLGEIAKVKFFVKSSQDDGMFLVHDFFLTNEKYAFNTAPVEVIRKGETWRPTAFPRRRGIKAGSPMDRSPKVKKTVAELGRIIPDGRGNFVFEKDPEKRPVRFNSTGINQPIDHYSGDVLKERQRRVVDHNKKVRREKDKWSVPPVIQPDWYIPDGTHAPYAEKEDTKGYRAFVHQEIEAAIEADYRAGYRIRNFDGDASWHYVCAERGLDFDEDVMDLLYYTIKCMEDRGMYLTWDYAPEPCYPGKPWNPETWPKEAFVNPFGESALARTNMVRCKQAARQLLGSKNPYTGMTIAESDMLMAICTFGETIFYKNCQWHADFIKGELVKKYGEDEEGFERIQEAWKGCWDPKWTTYEKVWPGKWLSEKTQRGRDLVEICRRVADYRYGYWRDYLREIGFRGPITPNLIVNDFLRMENRIWPNSHNAGNSYHSFPFEERTGPYPIMRNWQASSIAEWCWFYRGFASGRMYNQPFLIIEGDFAWMNSKRYEQAFGMYALGAMAGFTSMRDFSAGGWAAYHDPGELKRGGVGALGNFNGIDDPVHWVTEFLGWWMQTGGCVTPSDVTFRIDVSMDEVEEKALWEQGLGGDQTVLAFIGRLMVNLVPKGQKAPPADKTRKEMVFPRTGKGSTTDLGGVGGLGVEAKDVLFAKPAINPEGKLDLASVIDELKRRGWIKKDNRTDFQKAEFESSTGELFLSCKRRIGTVNSERMRALFTWGELEDIPGFKVTKLEPFGVAAVVAIDGKPIEESKEMVLCFATDAMNQEQIFASPDHRTCVYPGFGPPLTRAGKLDCEIANAGSFTMQALYPDGDVLEDVTKCVRSEGGKLAVSLDTSAFAEVTPFFYLKAK